MENIIENSAVGARAPLLRIFNFLSKAHCQSNNLQQRPSVESSEKIIDHDAEAALDVFVCPGARPNLDDIENTEGKKCGGPPPPASGPPRKQATRPRPHQSRCRRDPQRRDRAQLRLRPRRRSRRRQKRARPSRQNRRPTSEARAARRPKRLPPFPTSPVRAEARRRRKRLPQHVRALPTRTAS